MEMDKTMHGSRELEFAIFCIENVASKLNVDATKVYAALTEQTDILNEYIIPEYEVLHTQSKEYIVNDIIDIMKPIYNFKASDGEVPWKKKGDANERKDTGADS